MSFDADGTAWPTVTLDVSEEPAVADLARVHAVEGIGDVRTTARRIDSDDGTVFLVGIALTRPVTAAFAIAFSLPAHDPFLRAAATAERLVLATTDPGRADQDRPLWLAIDLDAPAFLAALDGSAD